MRFRLNLDIFTWHVGGGELDGVIGKCFFLGLTPSTYGYLVPFISTIQPLEYLTIKYYNDVIWEWLSFLFLVFLGSTIKDLPLCSSKQSIGQTPHMDNHSECFNVMAIDGVHAEHALKHQSRCYNLLKKHCFNHKTMLQEAFYGIILHKQMGFKITIFEHSKHRNIFGRLRHKSMA